MRGLFRSLGILGVLLVLPVVPLQAKTLTFAERLSGRIVLQVQSHGEAWYIDPGTKTRFYLGTPDDAFQLLRTKGLGIHHADIIRYLASRFPNRLAGRILLDVDDRGRAYYVPPMTLRAVRLGSAQETYRILREQGLGMTNSDLAHIPIGSDVLPSSITPPAGPSSSSLLVNPSTQLLREEQRTQLLINQHRQSLGLQPLLWNESVAFIARRHSQEMASGKVSFGHEGLDARFAELEQVLPLSRMGENVAMNTYDDPVATAVAGWLQSQGHRENIENENYTETGIGIVKGPGDAYYFTQIFVTRR